MNAFDSMLALAPLAVTWFAHATAADGPAKTVALPAPKLEGKVSIERALKDRRAVRTLATTALTLDEIGQLCWAAQGVTDDKGHRAAPSAHATYPLELYVIAGDVTGVAPGIYHYQPAKHALELVTAGDKRAKLERQAVGQDWIAQAPALLVVAGTPEKMALMQDRGVQFMWTEAGLAAQGFLLEATAMGLGSTIVGGFKPAEARSVLGLGASQEVLAVLPVGHKL